MAWRDNQKITRFCPSRACDTPLTPVDLPPRPETILGSMITGGSQEPPLNSWGSYWKIFGDPKTERIWQIVTPQESPNVAPKFTVGHIRRHGQKMELGNLNHRWKSLRRAHSPWGGVWPLGSKGLFYLSHWQKCSITISWGASLFQELSWARVLMRCSCFMLWPFILFTPSWLLAASSSWVRWTRSLFFTSSIPRPSRFRR